MPKCYDCGTKLPWITQKTFFALENGKKVGRICESCYKKRMEKDVSASIKSVPIYDKAIKYLADWIELEYEIVTMPLFREIYGNSLVEIAMDKTHISMLLPSSINAKANFQSLILSPLNSLNMGVMPDGIAVVGLRKTLVNRKYIDGFINCMQDIYGVSWKNIQALIHKTQACPILLVTDHLTFSVAPIVIEVGTAWETAKYDPESKIAHKEVVKEVVKIPCRYCGYLVEITLSKCPNCGGAIK